MYNCTSERFWQHATIAIQCLDLCIHAYIVKIKRFKEEQCTFGDGPGYERLGP